MEKITLLISDDHMMIRESWNFILNKDPRFNVIALARTGEEAVELVKQFHPDVVLMDINLPGINGIEATQVIRSVSPTTKVLGVSMHTQPAYVRKMMQQGACGYISKNSSMQEMYKAIIAVYNDYIYLSDEVKDTMASLSFNNPDQQTAFNSISKKELEVVEFIKKGYSSREIADCMKVSTKTIERHRYNILKKLKLKNSASLVNYFNNNN